MTYTSLARDDLELSDLEAIHETAVRENAAGGITGLLIFNGTHFLQILEGAPEGLSRLIEELRRDQRHSGLEVRHDVPIDGRSFPDWSMELVKVSEASFLAVQTINDRLPKDIAPGIRNRVIRMTESICVRPL